MQEIKVKSNIKSLTISSILLGILSIKSLNAAVTNDLNISASVDANATCKCIQPEVIETQYLLKTETAADSKLFNGEKPTYYGTQATDNSLYDTNIAQQKEIEDLKNKLAIMESKITPVGIISMWSGTTPPDGWVLCDGTNGTPDLRDRFIVGAGSKYSVGAIGGSADAVNIAHTHLMTGSTDVAGKHTHPRKNGLYQNNAWTSYATAYGNLSNTLKNASIPSSYAAGEHSHKINAKINSSGVSGVNKNLPPYYALAFIMKIK